MKKLSFYSLFLILLAVTFTSCQPNDPSFDQTLLVGKWKSGTEFWRYDSDGMGVTWDTSDNVTEAEGQKFKWTLNNADLIQLHYVEVTGQYSLNKSYIVSVLSATTLSYKDDFDKSFTFTKVTP